MRSGEEKDPRSRTGFGGRVWCCGCRITCCLYELDVSSMLAHPRWNVFGSAKACMLGAETSGTGTTARD